MYTLLISFAMFAGLLIYKISFRAKRKRTGESRISKNQNDTSDANYAINEHGFLERIGHDKLSRHPGQF